MKVKVGIRREAAIRAGTEVHGTLIVDVAVAELSGRQREALTSLKQYEYGPDIEGKTLDLPGAVADQAAVAAALDEVADKAEAQAAQNAAEVEQEVQRLLTLPQAEFEGGWLSGYSPTSNALRDPRLAGRVASRTLYQQGQETQKRQAEAEARARSQAAQAAKEAEAAAKAQARQAQREGWVAIHGSPNQQARLAAGLLPVKEVEEAMAEEVFDPLASFAPYQPMTARDVCTCEYDEPCHVDFSSSEADSATAEEWEGMEAIRTTLPGAEYQLREHRGESKLCEHTVTRRGVKVTVTVGAYRFSREYAV